MMLAMIGGRSEPDDTLRVAAAVAGSLALGWAVFGPHLAAVLGNPPDVPLGPAVAEAVAAILGRPPAPRRPTAARRQ